MALELGPSESLPGAAAALVSAGAVELTEVDEVDEGDDVDEAEVVTDVTKVEEDVVDVGVGDEVDSDDVVSPSAFCSLIKTFQPATFALNMATEMSSPPEKAI